MRTTIIILSLLFSGVINAQIVVPSDSQRVENSKSNLIFAYENMGKKVGNGICRELAYQAIEKNHRDDLRDVLTNAYLFEIKDGVINGDVVTFKNVLYQGDTIKYHVGIVLSTTKDGFYYADQNVGYFGEKNVRTNDGTGMECNVLVNSKVQREFFYYKNKKGGMVQFFRF